MNENRVLGLSTFGRKRIHFNIYAFNQDASNLFTLENKFLKTLLFKNIQNVFYINKNTELLSWITMIK